MTSITNANTAFPINPLTGYDDSNHQVALVRLKNITTDSTVTPNIVSGDLGVQVEVTTAEPADLSTTGTISAAQSGINTPVSNATVVLTVGTGQSTWKAQLLAGGGGFTSGTTMVADKSPDGGTTWYSASFKVAGASPATTVTSVVGPGPLELTGNAAGVSHVRIRCSVLNSTETIAVTLRGSVAIGDIGLMSSIPVGTNNIGNVGIQGLNNSGAVETWQSNQDNIVLLASAARTTTQTVADQTNVNARGVIVVLDMTVAGASPSVTLTIQGKDPVSGKYYTLLAGAAVTTVSTNVYTVYPGAPATANVSANSPLPRTWRVLVTANNANSGTYSVGASLIV